jgi:ADP-ribose diphosphatase
MASYQLIEKQVLYDGKKVRLELHHLQSEEDGKRTKREVCVHPGAVCVIPFVDDNTIILIRNKRYAVGQLLIELCAGTLDPKEAPINCAGRELLEETGYLAGKMQPIGNFFSSPGILSEKMYAFVAYDLQESHAALEEGEEIELEPAGMDEAIEMIREGRIHDAKTIATLLMYDRFFRGKQV